MKDNQANKYLQKALLYDQLANYYKYIDPSKHIKYYQKHFSYMQLLKNPNVHEDITTHTIRGIMSKVRIFHAVPDVLAIDIYINGRKAFQNLQYKSLSDYLRLAHGEYNFSIYLCGQTDSAIFNKTISIQPGKTCTIIVSGTQSNFDLIKIPDQKYVPVGESKLRFAHFSPDIPPVDIAVRNGDTLFPNVGYKQATNYMRLTPLSAQLDVRVAGTNQIIVSMPNIKLRANHAYTIVGIGLSEGLPKFETFILNP